MDSFAHWAAGSLHRPLGALAFALGAAEPPLRNERKGHPYQPDITCPFAAAALRRDDGLRRIGLSELMIHPSIAISFRIRRRGPLVSRATWYTVCASTWYTLYPGVTGAPQAKRGAPEILQGSKILSSIVTASRSPSRLRPHRGRLVPDPLIRSSIGTTLRIRCRGAPSAARCARSFFRNQRSNHQSAHHQPATVLRLPMHPKPLGTRAQQAAPL